MVGIIWVVALATVFSERYVRLSNKLSALKPFIYCNLLYTQIAKLQKEFRPFASSMSEEGAAIEKQLKFAEGQLDEHRKRAYLSRQQYYQRRTKAIKPENITKGYLSMVIDGAGAQASNYCPRYSTTEKGEPARHNMLKIKSTYVKVGCIVEYSIRKFIIICIGLFKVHGLGGFVLTSPPDLEKKGANLTVEALLRGIRFAAAQRGVTSFRNIYVQVDNTGTNKCDTLVVACALLVALGICKKIKVNYLEVGHTHEDIDAWIGNVVTHLRKTDIRTFEQRMKAIKLAIKKDESQVKAVEEVIGITDYEAAVKSFQNPKLGGISVIKEFRITNLTQLLMGGILDRLKSLQISAKSEQFSNTLSLTLAVTQWLSKRYFLVAVVRMVNLVISSIGTILLDSEAAKR